MAIGHRYRLAVYNARSLAARAGKFLAPVCNRLRRGDHSGDPDRTLSAYADELDLLSIFSENPWIVIATLLGEYAVAYITLAFSVATLSVCYDRLLARIANDPLYTLGAGPFIDQ